MKFHLLILPVALIQCTTSDNIKKNEAKTDTLTYNFPSENKRLNFVYNYHQNLSQLSEKQLRRDEMKIKNNIDLDVEKCSRCEDYAIYLYSYYNNFYIDTINFNEIILFHCMTTDGLRKEKIYDNSFGKRINKLYPDAKYISSSIHETKECFEDDIEFLRAEVIKGKIKFTYSNFKKVIYKSDWSYIKVLYVKKGIDKKDMLSTIMTYKQNNKFTRVYLSRQDM